MKALKWILATIAVLVVAAFGFLFYMGLFSTYPVTEENVGPHTFVYESFVGPYSQAGPVFDRVNKAMEREGIPVTSKGIGIYHDNPQIVASDKLRSDCGVIIGEESAKKWSKVGKEGSPYKIGHLEASSALVMRFPIRNNFSYMIGPQKAYPALASAAKEKGYSASAPYEIYDMDANMIEFVMPYHR